MRGKILAWHFLHANRCLSRHGENTPVEAGYIYTTDEPELVLCRAGLHGSVLAIDALRYAPGPVVCRVRMCGEIQDGRDKIVARHREVLAIADVTEELRAFARWCALQVIHLWDAPQVVREYLATGREDLRAAAVAAAWAAAGAAAGAA